MNNMKRIIALIIVGTMTGTFFCSCGNKEKETGKANATQAVTPAESKNAAEDEKDAAKRTSSNPKDLMEDIKKSAEGAGSEDDSDDSSSKGGPSTDAGSVKKELPEGFPVDELPLVEGAKITQSTSFKGIGGTVIYTAGKPLDDVYKFYKAKLENLDQYNEMLNNGTWNFYAVTEKYRFVVVVKPTGENSVQVMLTAKLED